jgi:hypothetical protein
MAKAPIAKLQLLRWTEATGGESIGDPLGLELRVEARLLSQLLHCITSVTPRARYYSFLPWCVQEFRRSRQSSAGYGSLRSMIRAREKALVLACIAHHEGETCEGMAVVGTRPAKTLYAERNGDAVDLSKFRDDPKNSMAWNQYFGSLQNLGVFKLTEPFHGYDDAEEEADSLTADDLELSEIGERLASSYGDPLGFMKVTAALREGNGAVTWTSLASFGARGGVCEIMRDTPTDREVLRDLFFDKLPRADRGRGNSSHPFRRQSLLLLMDLARQLGAAGAEMTERAFADAVYHGVMDANHRVVEMSAPAPLQDIGLRWRMFYLHYYMALGLEAAFKAVVGLADEAGMRGTTLPEILQRLDSPTSGKRLSGLLQIPMSAPFLDLSWTDLATASGVRLGAGDCGDRFDEVASLHWLLAERRLSELVRQKGKTGYPEILGLGLALVLTSLARLRRWSRTSYGTWLAKASDSHRDLTPPLVWTWLEQRHREWWSVPMRAFVEPLLQRFVVDQHEWLGYEKGAGSSKIILHQENGRLTASDRFDDLGVGNPRFWNALRILKDLGLMESDDGGITIPTAEGTRWLEQELAAETPA